MISYVQDDDGVSVNLKVNGIEEKVPVRAKFLLGTDGAKGSTRRGAGINFVGETKEIRAVIGDIELNGYERADEVGNRTVSSSRTRTML